MLKFIYKIDRKVFKHCEVGTQCRKEQELKSTGIVRKVDELGRIVLPVELRRTMGIAEKDSLEIYVDGGAIILRKYVPEVIDGRCICEICKREFEPK